MTERTAGSESPIPVLTLFVTGDAPRSRRARANLDQALKSLGREHVKPMEIDLLQHPDQSERHSVFATPALVRMDRDGHKSILYGDLSEESKLNDFLEGIGD
jgi:circadian clock protein KaiB